MANLDGLTISDTGFLGLPRGSTAERPGSPSVGYLRFNTDFGVSEVFDGSIWLDVSTGMQSGLVLDGLVLALDAGNTKSYSGSGTLWFDLSKNSYSGELENGTSYSSGEFVFDGVDDEVNMLSGPGTSVSNTFTWDIWCKPTTTHQIDSQSTSGFGGVSGQRYVIGAVNSSTEGGAGVSVGTNGVSVYEHGSSYMPALLVSSTSISSTSISQITIVYNNKTPSFYLNGVFVKTGLTSLKSFVYAQTSKIGYGDYGFFQGSLSVLSLYNRALTSLEIQQNFNAFKTRFGL